MREHKATKKAADKREPGQGAQNDNHERTFKAGDEVTWNSSQGTVHGTVEKKLTEPMDIKSHHVAASQDNPEYLVKSSKTGAQAAHKPEELSKTSNPPNEKKHEKTVKGAAS